MPLVPISLTPSIITFIHAFCCWAVKRLGGPACTSVCAAAALVGWGDSTALDCVVGAGLPFAASWNMRCACSDFTTVGHRLLALAATEHLPAASPLV
jgi:hypothetical protein